MAITYVASATGTTTATLPAHNVGDLVIVFAYREGSTVPPTLPAGWTNITSGSLVSAAYRVGYRVSDGTLTVVGTWTSAAAVVAMIYRGASSVGITNAVQTRTTSPVIYPALTITGSPRWVIGFSASSDDTNTTLFTPPSGMVNRTSIRNTVVVAGHDSNSALSTWTAQSTTLPYAATNIGVVLGLLEASVSGSKWYVTIIGD